MSPKEIAPTALTLPGAFRRAGYYTVGNGKIFHQREDAAEQSWSEPPFSPVNGKQENNHLTFHDKESARFILKKNERGPFYEGPDVPDNTYIDGQTCGKAIEDMQRLTRVDKPFFLACGFVRLLVLSMFTGTEKLMNKDKEAFSTTPSRTGNRV